jgi:hypothetical protein
MIDGGRGYDVFLDMMDDTSTTTKQRGRQHDFVTMEDLANGRIVYDSFIRCC